MTCGVLCFTPTSSGHTGVNTPQIGFHDPQALHKGASGSTKKEPNGSFLEGKADHQMHCPFCRSDDTRVIDSRTNDDGTNVRRRRQCTDCNRRFTTVENAVLLVIKRNGVVEAFDRSKIINGVKKACQGRPVSDADLAILASKVEENLRLGGFAEIDAHDIGLAVLSPLRELDEIAYMRYASVYRSFESLQDFETEIAMLRAGLIGEVAAASTTESNISVSDRDGSASLQKQ